MTEKTIHAIKSTYGVCVYLILLISKTVFDEGSLSNFECCVGENLDQVIENLGTLAEAAEGGDSDAHLILDYVRECIVYELCQGTYFLGDEPTIDKVCDLLGKVMECLDKADERVKAVFLYAIKDATIKLGLTIDTSVKDPDVRQLFDLDQEGDATDAESGAVA